jgi:hypothetical protein
MTESAADINPIPPSLFDSQGTFLNLAPDPEDNLQRRFSAPELSICTCTSRQEGHEEEEKEVEEEQVAAHQREQGSTEEETEKQMQQGEQEASSICSKPIVQCPLIHVAGRSMLQASARRSVSRRQNGEHRINKHERLLQQDECSQRDLLEC